MKSYWKIGITSLGLAMALTLSGCGTAIEKTSNFVIGEDSGTGDMISEGVKSFRGDTFQRIDVVTEAMEVVIKQGEDEEASVEFLRDSSIDKEFAFDASVQANVLQVTVGEKEKLFSSNDERGGRKLIITMPADQEHAVNVENAFGKVLLDEVVLSSAAVQLNAGSIVARGVTGELDLLVDAGDIRVENGHGSYPITAHADAGSIQISYGQAPAQAAFDLRVEAGKVQLDLDDVKYEKQSNTVIKAERGSGGPLIKASAEVGNIKVN